MLSHLLRQKGEHSESAALAEQGIRLKPGMVEAYFQFALNMLAMGRPKQASDTLTKALAIRADIAPFHLNLGIAQEMLGRRRAAKRSFQEAFRLNPQDLQARLCLIAQQVLDEEFEAARVGVEEAVRISPRSATALLVKAEVLLTLDERREADACIDKALTLDPNSSTGHAMSGFRWSQAGKFDRAETAFRRSIQLDRAQGLSYMGLTQAKKLTEADRPLIRHMEKVRAECPLSPDEASSLHFALAKAHDDLGEPGKAMAAYDEAHRFAFLFRFGEGSFDTEDYRRSIDNIRDLYPGPGGADHVVASDLPILIVGMIRSGTTLTEQILSSHPDVGAAGEHQFWKRHTGRSDALAELAADPSKAAKLAEEYVRTLHAISPETPRVTDKMPGNYLRLGLIRSVLPNAKIIHCRRSPIDTALSIYVTPNRTGSSFSHSKEGIVFAYRQYLELMDHWCRVLPAGSFLEVDYEDLVADPEPAMRRMLEFCELDWSDACLHPERNSKEVWTPSLWQVRQPIYKTSVERWRKYEPWLGAFRELL